MTFDFDLLQLLTSSELPPNQYVKFKGWTLHQLQELKLCEVSPTLQRILEAEGQTVNPSVIYKLAIKLSENVFRKPPTEASNRSDINSPKQSYDVGCVKIEPDLTHVKREFINDDDRIEPTNQTDVPSMQEDAVDDHDTEVVGEVEPSHEVADLEIESALVSGKQGLDAELSDDDEVKIVGEIENVSYICKREQKYEEVSFVDDEDIAPDDSAGSSTSPGSAAAVDQVFDANRLQSNPAHCSLRATPKQQKRRTAVGGVHLRLDSGTLKIRSGIKIRKSEDESSENLFAYDELSLGSSKFEFVESLECINWCWTIDAKRRSSFTKYGLYELLQPGGFCANVHQLIFSSNAKLPSQSQACGKLLLPSLSMLKINQGLTPLNYKIELTQVIHASNLRSVELTSIDEYDLSQFLEILQNAAPRLTTLHSMVLRNEREDVALSGELELIIGLNLPQLNELHLVYSLWGTAKLEPLLNNFGTTLRKLKIEGCFTTDAHQDPTVTINFPSMPQLEVLDFGQGQAFESSFENVWTRPVRRKCRMTQVQRFEGASNSTPQKEEDDDFEQHGGGFKVTLALQPMPNLKELILSSLYSLKDFHFSMFPSLEIFRVGSDWHLSTPNRPVPVREGKVYSNIREFQLPDFLADHTFVNKIPASFPNIEKAYINMPAVKVIRAFANTMKNSTSLKHLVVRTQFDFASCLNYCFVKDSSSIVQSDQERTKVATLLDYEQHDEYIKEHNIQVPTFDADGDEFEGLYVFQRNTAAPDGSFVFHHVPRTLRLPKGPHMWNSTLCEFTQTLIGFKEIPISLAAWCGAPEGFRYWHLDDTGLPKADRMYGKERVTMCKVSAAGVSSVVKKDQQ